MSIYSTFQSEEEDHASYKLEEQIRDAREDGDEPPVEAGGGANITGISDEALAEADAEVERLYEIGHYYKTWNEFLNLSGAYTKNLGLLRGTATDEAHRSDSAEQAFQAHYEGNYQNLHAKLNLQRQKMTGLLVILSQTGQKIRDFSGRDTKNYRPSDIIDDFTLPEHDCAMRREFYRRHVRWVLRILNHQTKRMTEFPLSYGQMEHRYKAYAVEKQQQ